MWKIETVEQTITTRDKGLTIQKIEESFSFVVNVSYSAEKTEEKEQIKKRLLTPFNPDEWE